MVLVEDLAARAETSDLFFLLAGGLDPCVEELGRLEFIQVVGFIIRVYGVLLAADLPVFFRIFGGIHGRIYCSTFSGQGWIIGFLVPCGP
ncbi:MAG: hypothetical protein WCF90_10360 [Methanomicrobiales archaeon]